jgi:hypothetical protein
MHNERFRLMTVVAGATMCLFAASAYGQTPTTTGSTGTPTTGTTDYNGSAATQAGTTNPTAGGTVTGTTTTGTTTTENSVATTPVDNTAPVTDTGRRGFSWGLLGLLGLVGLFRGRSTQVRETTYTTTPNVRTVGTGTAYDDRTGTAVPRAASGTSTTGGNGGSGSMGDPGSRR